MRRADDANLGACKLARRLMKPCGNGLRRVVTGLLTGSALNGHGLTNRLSFQILGRGHGVDTWMIRIFAPSPIRARARMRVPQVPCLPFVTHLLVAFPLPCLVKYLVSATKWCRATGSPTSVRAWTTPRRACLRLAIARYAIMLVQTPAAFAGFTRALGAEAQRK